MQWFITLERYIADDTYLYLVHTPQHVYRVLFDGIREVVV